MESLYQYLPHVIAHIIIEYIENLNHYISMNELVKYCGKNHIGVFRSYYEDVFIYRDEWKYCSEYNTLFFHGSKINPTCICDSHSTWCESQINYWTYKNTDSYRLEPDGYYATHFPFRRTIYKQSLILKRKPKIVLKKQTI